MRPIYAIQPTHFAEFLIDPPLDLLERTKLAIADETPAPLEADTFPLEALSSPALIEAPLEAVRPADVQLPVTRADEPDEASTSTLSALTNTRFTDAPEEVSTSRDRQVIPFADTDPPEEASTSMLSDWRLTPEIISIDAPDETSYSFRAGALIVTITLFRPPCPNHSILRYILSVEPDRTNFTPSISSAVAVTFTLTDADGV